MTNVPHFTKIDGRWFGEDSILSIMDVFFIDEPFTIEDICKRFEICNNKQIRETGILTSTSIKHVSTWTREKDPKKIVPERILFVGNNKKLDGLMCIFNLSVWEKV